MITDIRLACQSNHIVLFCPMLSLFYWQFISWCQQSKHILQSKTPSLLPRWSSVWQEPGDPQHIWWEKSKPKVDCGDSVILRALTSWSLVQRSFSGFLIALYCSSVRPVSTVIPVLPREMWSVWGLYANTALLCNILL